MNTTSRSDDTDLMHQYLSPQIQAPCVASQQQEHRNEHGSTLIADHFSSLQQSIRSDATLSMDITTSPHWWTMAGDNDDGHLTASFPSAEQSLAQEQQPQSQAINDWELRPDSQQYQFSSQAEDGHNLIQLDLNEQVVQNCNQSNSCLSLETMSPGISHHNDMSSWTASQQPDHDHQLAHPQPPSLQIPPSSFSEITSNIVSPSEISPHSQTAGQFPHIPPNPRAQSYFSQPVSHRPFQQPSPQQPSPQQTRWQGALPPPTASQRYEPTYRQPQLQQSYPCNTTDPLWSNGHRCSPVNHYRHPSANYAPIDSSSSQPSNQSSMSSQRTSNTSYDVSTYNRVQSMDVFSDTQSPPEQTRKKSSADSTLTENEKRDLFLERNRAAAAKCRQKKKAQDEETQRKRAVHEEHNKSLKMERETLIGELLKYKDACLNHIAMGCEECIDGKSMKEFVVAGHSREKLANLMKDWTDTPKLNALRRNLVASSKSRTGGVGKRKRSSRTDDTDVEDEDDDFEGDDFDDAEFRV